MDPLLNLRGVYIKKNFGIKIYKLEKKNTIKFFS